MRCTCGQPGLLDFHRSAPARGGDSEGVKLIVFVAPPFAGAFESTNPALLAPGAGLRVYAVSFIHRRVQDCGTGYTGF